MILIVISSTCMFLPLKSFPLKIGQTLFFSSGTGLIHGSFESAFNCDHFRSAEILYTLAHANSVSTSTSASRLTPNASNKKRASTKSVASQRRFDQSRALFRQLLEARRILNSFQHHDAITGTSRSNVAEDFARG